MVISVSNRCSCRTICTSHNLWLLLIKRLRDMVCFCSNWLPKYYRKISWLITRKIDLLNRRQHLTERCFLFLLGGYYSNEQLMYFRFNDVKIRSASLRELNWLCRYTINSKYVGFKYLYVLLSLLYRKFFGEIILFLKEHKNRVVQNKNGPST